MLNKYLWGILITILLVNSYYLFVQDYNRVLSHDEKIYYNIAIKPLNFDKALLGTADYPHEKVFFDQYLRLIFFFFGVSLKPVFIIQYFLYIITSLLFYFLARNYFTAPVSIFCCILYAICPATSIFVRLLMSEILMLFLLMIFLILIHKLLKSENLGLIIATAIIGLFATMTRPIFIFFPFLCVIYLWFKSQCVIQGKSSRFTAIMFLIICICCIVPYLCSPFGQIGFRSFFRTLGGQEFLPDQTLYYATLPLIDRYFLLMKSVYIEQCEIIYATVFFGKYLSYIFIFINMSIIYTLFVNKFNILYLLWVSIMLVLIFTMSVPRYNTVLVPANIILFIRATKSVVFSSRLYICEY